MVFFFNFLMTSLKVAAILQISFVLQVCIIKRHRCTKFHVNQKLTRGKNIQNFIREMPVTDVIGLISGKLNDTPATFFVIFRCNILKATKSSNFRWNGLVLKI